MNEQGNDTKPRVRLPPISSFDTLVPPSSSSLDDMNKNNYNITLPDEIVLKKKEMNYPVYVQQTALKDIKKDNDDELWGDSDSEEEDNNTTTTTTNTKRVINPQIQKKTVFTTLSNVNGNEPVKKKRKKQECPTCGNFYSNLSTHRSTHLTVEQRPHVCKVCMRGFARHNDLVRHSTKHALAKSTLQKTLSKNKEEDYYNDDDDDDNDDDDDDDNNDDNNEQEEQKEHSDDTDLSRVMELFNIRGTHKCPFHLGLLTLFYTEILAKLNIKSKSFKDLKKYNKYAIKDYEIIGKIIQKHKQEIKDGKLEFKKSKVKGTQEREVKYCHHLGVFTRRDTFKNHMKSLHFTFSIPVKKRSLRSSIGGECKQCGKYYESSEEWLNEHILKFQCGHGKYYASKETLEKLGKEINL